MRILFALILAMAALPAYAHPGHGVMTGFLAGFAHPFSGLDHLLAMIAVGLWSATSARRVWLAPLSFATLLLLGAVLSATGWLILPAQESMIAASVLLLGLLVMTGARLPDTASALLIGGFALFHGAAHGQELESGLALAGMVAATALLHLSGIAIGLQLKTAELMTWRRGIGAGIAMAGAGLVLELL